MGKEINKMINHYWKKINKYHTFFIVIVSTLIGNLLSIPFLPIFDGVGVKNTYSIYSMIICTIASILLSTLICTILSQKLKYISPIKCLKDL